ncbi:MAG TPA: hypothetical protein VKE93_07210 [Candidatus Angelobacter sp.]|nr:hypothetical protein [Candidatus Angelobacter sp.]
MGFWHALANFNLLILASDHFITSAMGICFPQKAARLYERMFGATMPLTPELIAVLKPWGALGIFASLAGLLPVFDPVRYRGVLYALLVLLALRVVIRVWNANTAQRHFNLSLGRNLFHIGLILLCATVIAGQLVWW